MDLLHIQHLQVSTKIGVYAWEQQIKQTLLFDLAIPFDSSLCDDKLENTLNYEKICQTVTEFVENHSFQLIETVANEVASLLKATFNLSQISLSVSKPQAIKNAKEVKISIQR